MAWLVAVDPGTANLGIALFRDGVLVASAYMRYPTRDQLRAWVAERTAGEEATWVRERMQKYESRPDAHGNLDDIEGLMKGLPFSQAYTPRKWKASVPKHIHHNRVAAVLRPEEIATWSMTNPDEKDAIAIGLYHLGRLLKGGRPGTARRVK